jgi:hypothetical protein
MPKELLLSVAQLNLSVRASGCLKKRDIHYLADLVSLTESDLLEGRNCGWRTVRELSAMLRDFGLSLSMQIPTLGRAEIAKLAKRHAPELSRIRQAWRQRRYGIDSRSGVETEIASALAAVLTSKHAARIESWIGLDQSALPTLQSAGDIASITRERIRQIVKMAKRRLGAVQFEMPRLHSAIDALSRLPEWSESRARSLLVSMGLATRKISIQGLLRATELFGVPVPSTVKNAPVAARAKQLAMVKKIGRAGRRAVTPRGCSSIDEVCAQVNNVGDTTITAEVVREILMARPDFHWLDEGSGWFWMECASHQGRNNLLLNRVDKVLAVAPRIDLAVLRASIVRDHRMAGFVPPRRVLASFCRQLKDCRIVGGRTVVDKRPRAPAAVLPRGERTMVAVFRVHGPLLSVADALRLCREAGLKKNLILRNLYGSPIIRRVAGGVFALVGTRVTPSEAKPNTSIGDRAVYQAALDYGWRPDDSGLWVTYRISEALTLSGKSAVPDAIKSCLDPRGYELHDRDGSRMGHADISGACMSGLLPFFRQGRGTPGDHLRVTFDLAKHVALVELSEEPFDNRGSFQ